MDYEQKYKQALERAREELGSGCYNKGTIEYIFPELKESEDERIRKSIIKHYEVYKYDSFDGILVTDILAWLEKQGEQKPTDKVEPKFKVGDIMRTLQEASNGITNGMPVVVSIDNEYYRCNNEIIAIKDQDNYEYPPKNREQKPVWSEEDEKIIETMCKEGDLRPSQMIWLKSLKNRVQPYWKPTDEQMEGM